MLAEDFVNMLRVEVIDDNLKFYRRIYHDTDVTKVTDPYYSEALSFFKTLSVKQQDLLFEIIRVSSVDTISMVLGVLDGSTTVRNFHADFGLFYDKQTEPLNGDLQDIFLELEEERNIKKYNI